MRNDPQTFAEGEKGSKMPFWLWWWIQNDPERLSPNEAALVVSFPSSRTFAEGEKESKMPFWLLWWMQNDPPRLFRNEAALVVSFPRSGG